MPVGDRKSLQHTQEPRNTFQMVSKPSVEHLRGHALNANAPSNQRLRDCAFRNDAGIAEQAKD